MALDPIGVIFIAKDLASATISKLDRNFKSLDQTVDGTSQRFAKNMKLMGAGLVAVGVGLAGLSVVKNFTDAASSFEANLVRLGSVASASAKDLTMLEQKALELGVAFEFSPDEAVQGMRQLASVGFNTGQIMTGIEQTLLFASASQGQINIETAASTMAAAIRGFGLEVTDSQKVVDVLTKATSISALKFDELGLTLGNTAADASLANQSFETTVATLGALRNTGLTSLRASEKLRISLKNLSSDKATATAAKLGIKLRDEETGKLKQMDAIVGDLAPKLAGLTQIQKEQALGNLFGKQALSVFNAVANATFETVENGEKVILKGADALAMMRQELTSSGGTAKEFQADFLASTEGINTLLQGTLETFKIALGKPLLGIIGKVTKAITDFANIFLAFFIEFPLAAKIFTGVLAGLSAFLVIVGGVIALKAGIVLLGLAFSALGISLIPILIVFAKVALVIGLIAVAFFLLKKAIQTNFGGLGDFFGDLFTNISLFFKAVMTLVSGGEISAELNKQLDESGVGKFLDSFLRGVTMVKTAFTSFFGGIAKGFGAVAGPSIEMFVTSLVDLANTFGTIFGRVFSSMGILSGIFGDSFPDKVENIGDIFGVVGIIVGGVLGAIVGGFATVASWITKSIDLILELGTFFMWLGNVLLEAFISPIDTIMSLWGKLKDVILSIVESFTSNPLIKFALDKLGISTENEDKDVATSNDTLVAPTGGLDTAQKSAEAQAGVVSKTGGETNEALSNLDNSKGGEVNASIKLMIGERQLAETMTRIGRRSAVAAGGQF